MNGHGFDSSWWINCKKDYNIHDIYSIDYFPVSLYIKEVGSLEHTTSEHGGLFKAHSTGSAIKLNFLLFSYCCGINVFFQQNDNISLLHNTYFLQPKQDSEHNRPTYCTWEPRRWQKQKVVSDSSHTNSLKPLRKHRSHLFNGGRDG